MLRPRLTPAAAAMWVTLLALLIRLPALQLPVVIGNDGAGYLLWAQQLLAGERINWPPYRTPGYTSFLTAVIYLLGPSSLSIVIAQQLLGISAAALIAFTAAHLFRPRHGLIVGGIAAIDPVFIALASHAMTELLASFLLLLSASIVLLHITATRPRPLLTAACLGAALAALVLVRPAFQVTLPFFALSLLVSSRRRHLPLAVVAFALTFGAITGPWLLHNHRRGITGFSAGSSMFIWIGASHNNLLSADYPLPEHIRSEYESSVRPYHFAQGPTHTLLNRIDVWSRPEPRRLLVSWALSSLADTPAGYCRAAFRSLVWQLDYFPRIRGMPGLDDNEMAWILRAPTIDHSQFGQAAPNFAFDGPAYRWLPFAAAPPRGPLTHYLGWIAHLGGTPALRIPFFAVASAALLIALHRRHWPLALLLAGTLAYFGMHIVFLLFNSRFSAPCWLVWYLAPAIAVASWRSSRGFIGPSGPRLNPAAPSADPIQPG